MKHGWLLLVLLLSFACNKNDDLIVQGIKPVYQEVDPSTIVSDEPQLIENGSKIYIKDDYVFIVENGIGVHVIDNQNPSNPNGLRFLYILGVTDVAVRQNIMYANLEADLVAINIEDLMNVEVTNSIKGVYDFNLDILPPSYWGYFECYDLSKGVVVDWEEAELVNPKCRR